MDVTWNQDGDRYIAHFSGTGLIAIFYPIEMFLWRWEFRFEERLVRCGTCRSFEHARDVAFALIMKEKP